MIKTYKKTALVASALVLASVIGGSTAFGYGYGYGYGYGSTPTPTVPPIVMPPVKFMFNMNLAYGMRNADVVQLQERLRAGGYFTFHTSTGYFGPITLASVKAYQAAHGIPNTGFVGVLTRGSLNK